MNILIFLIILALLVLVHEFGHFIVAKKSGVRVDEFGLGFPPKIFGIRKGETEYTLNAVPFGGFVKIFGENPEDERKYPGDLSRSLARKNRGIQAAVLAAGVSFNVIFAWLVISLGLIFGLPTAVDTENAALVSDRQTIVSSVISNSPAENAGLKAGDILTSLKTDSAVLDRNVTPKTVQGFITTAKGPMTVSYKRGTNLVETKVSAKGGITNEAPVIGVRLDEVGILKLPVYQAFLEGGIRTIQLFKAVTWNIFYFLRDAILGHADLSGVAGPVGMVALVGDARDLGFAYLIFFTALLSINLAVINLIPFPALDGGRLLVLLVEAIKRSPLKPKLIQSLNTVGFALLILLMVVVTGHDILNLF